MKRKLLFIVIILTICFCAFSEIHWLDMSDNEDVNAAAICYTKKEVLEVTHWKDLDSHFHSYLKADKASEDDYFLIMFIDLGTCVYEYHKGTKAVGYYFKTIFE